MLKDGRPIEREREIDGQTDREIDGQRERDSRWNREEKRSIN